MVAGMHFSSGGFFRPSANSVRFFRILRFPLKERFSRLGTIDLRVDYLRPGRGNEFIATAHIIRAGSKVTVARMELHNEEGTHIAFGTGTYLVG